MTNDGMTNDEIIPNDRGGGARDKRRQENGRETVRMTPAVKPYFWPFVISSLVIGLPPLPLGGLGALNLSKRHRGLLAKPRIWSFLLLVIGHWSLVISSSSASLPSSENLPRL